MNRESIIQSNLYTRLSPSLKHRIWFLVAGNLVLVGYIFLYTLQTEDSSFSSELSRLGPNIAPKLLAGLGLTGIICTGAIDLSIGAIVVVAGTVFGLLYERGAPPVVCFGACFATAAALSMVNGFVIRWLKIPAIIVTLAGLTFYRGLAIFLARGLALVNSEQITLDSDAASEIYKVPAKEYATVILIVTLAVALLWEAFGKTPRAWLAHGSSPEACRLKGMRAERIAQSSFLVGGLFLGLASLLEVTNLNTIEPSRMATGFELGVIGGVVLGGTNIFGGEGSYLGTALGMFFLYWVGQALIYAGVGVQWEVAVEGAVIIAVIGFDCAIHRKRKLLEELR